MTPTQPVSESVPDAFEVRLLYEVPPDMPTLFVQHMTVQGDPESFTMGFYVSKDPLIVGTDEQRLALIRNLQETGVKAHCVARLVMTPAAFARTVELLQDNLGKWKSAHGSDEER